jgi:hypothetical protein
MSKGFEGYELTSNSRFPSSISSVGAQSICRRPLGGLGGLGGQCSRVRGVWRPQHVQTLPHFAVVLPHGDPHWTWMGACARIWPGHQGKLQAQVAGGEV